MGHVFQEQTEFFDHKAKGHDPDGGPDPGEERSFIGHVDPAVLNPDLYYFGIFFGHPFSLLEQIAIQFSSRISLLSITGMIRGAVKTADAIPESSAVFRPHHCGT